MRFSASTFHYMSTYKSAYQWYLALKWSRFSEQIFRIDKWSLCQG